MNRPFALTLALVLSASACAPAHSPAPAPAVASADSLPNDVKWVRASAEYRALTRQTYAFAGERLPELARGLPAQGWAVILDGDTTALAEFGKRFFIIPNPMYGSWEHLH